MDEIHGGLGAEDVAKAESIRNLSESTTQAGAWRLLERNMLSRMASLDAREQALRTREEVLGLREAALDERQNKLIAQESAIGTAVRDAEIRAREAGTKVLEVAIGEATAIRRAALSETSASSLAAYEQAILLGQKAAVDAGAIRQAAQDHLVAGIALADSARLPAAAPPTGGELLIRLGQQLIDRAASGFEKLMIANPAACARFADGVASTVSQTPAEPTGAAKEPPRSPTFGDVAAAAEAIGDEALGEFMRKRGAGSLRELTIADGAALLELAALRQKASGDAPR